MLVSVSISNIRYSPRSKYFFHFNEILTEELTNQKAQKVTSFGNQQKQSRNIENRETLG